jgi:mono/diheme cytochrome c family protein
MIKLGLGFVGVMVVAMWAGATMQHGCKDVQTSLFHLSYYPYRDMRRTVAVIPQKITMRAPDTLTVPTIGAERAPDPALLVSNREAAAAHFVNTVPADDSSLARGERTFQRLCSPCHGRTMVGNGTVAPKFMPPPDLLGATTRGRSDGYIYSYVRYGGAIMPRYGQALSPSATWDVINFVRHQQKTSPR